MSQAREWIKQRLPAEATFTKHGSQQTVDEAITSALADHTGESETAQKKLALADLLDIIAADILFAEEKLGEWTGKDQLLTERAANLRDEAENEATTPGAFGFSPATFTSQGSEAGNEDEFGV